LAAVDGVPGHLGGLEVLDELVEELARLGRVVRAVVADVDVEREPLALGPRVDGEVRLREHDRAREAGALELMKAGVHGGEARGGHHVEDLGAKALAVQKELRVAAAAGEVTDEMQTIHARTLQNAKAQPHDTEKATPSIRALRRTQRSLIALNSFKTS